MHTGTCTHHLLREVWFPWDICTFPYYKIIMPVFNAWACLKDMDMYVIGRICALQLEHVYVQCWYSQVKWNLGPGLGKTSCCLEAWGATAGQCWYYKVRWIIEGWLLIPQIPPSGNQHSKAPENEINDAILAKFQLGQRHSTKDFPPPLKLSTNFFTRCWGIHKYPAHSEKGCCCKAKFLFVATDFLYSYCLYIAIFLVTPISVSIMSQWVNCVQLNKEKVMFYKVVCRQ